MVCCFKLRSRSNLHTEIKKYIQCGTAAQAKAMLLRVAFYSDLLKSFYRDKL